MEIIGFALAVVGVIFAFEAPRRKFIALFKKSPPIEHEFRVTTVFRAHNDGKALGPLGTNKTNKTYVLVWSMRNKSDQTLQIERGTVMRQRDRTKPIITLTAPEFTADRIVLPGHRLELFSVELTPMEIDHYRHWVRECDAFGLKDTSGSVFWVPDNQFGRSRTCCKG